MSYSGMPGVTVAERLSPVGSLHCFPSPRALVNVSNHVSVSFHCESTRQCKVASLTSIKETVSWLVS